MSRGTVLFVAGGTGGHVFPALAVAQEMRSRGYDLAWIGTQKGIEQRLVPAADIPLNLVRVAGLRGSGLGRKLVAPFMLASALWQCLRILGRIQPRLVVGFGGFVAGPAGLAARLRNIPLVIHEQNAVAGTTNRILSKLASRVLAAFPGALASAEVTGNPVRKQLVPLASLDLQPPLRLLVLGGSQGALALNRTLPGCFSQLARDLQIRHQCGDRWLEQTRQAYVEAGVDAEVVPFIDDMAAAYQWAHLVVCRAGAMTVSELAAVAKPALFIPFPYAIDDHQTANADWLVAQGAAQLLSESELAQRGGNLLAAMLQPPQLAALHRNARALPRQDATRRICDLCEEEIHAG